MDENEKLRGQRPKSPNCMKCVHYKVSWDPLLPNACEVFEIKSRLMPSVEVFRIVGENCPSFMPRTTQA